MIFRVDHEYRLRSLLGCRGRRGHGQGGVHGRRLKQAYAASLEKAWNASLAAVDEMKMRITEKSIDNLDQNREIKGKTDEGKDFQISLEATSKEVTTAKVRVGSLGR